jgi:hypothetical protein
MRLVKKIIYFKQQNNDESVQELSDMWTIISAMTIPWKIQNAYEIGKVETICTVLEILSLKHKFLTGSYIISC